jgi:hypothetical protein
MAEAMIRRIFRSVAGPPPLARGDARLRRRLAGAAISTMRWRRAPGAPGRRRARVALLTVPLNGLYSNVKITQELLDLSFTNVLRLGRGQARRPLRAFLSLPTSTAGDFVRAKNTLQYVPSGGGETIKADGLRDLFWSTRHAPGQLRVVDELGDGQSHRQAEKRKRLIPLVPVRSAFCRLSF